MFGDNQFERCVVTPNRRVSTASCIGRGGLRPTRRSRSSGNDRDGIHQGTPPYLRNHCSLAELAQQARVICDIVWEQSVNQ